MNYSIRFKSAQGITSRSEFLPFDTDGEARTYAAEALHKSPMVEVWKGDNLLARLPEETKRTPR
ncbi:MAG: hypothetical protein HY054_12460 [Proteobacteria bacterium]|nr:hypothetical protein [Pseudomonadota bacterium]